jgi:membrane protease YdiL (CAAX protease family)
VGLVVALLVATSLLAPIVASSTLLATIVHAFGGGMEFNRIYNRVFEVLLVIALWLWWRRLDLGGVFSIGFRRQEAGRDLGRGVLIGLGGVAAGLALAWLGGGLVVVMRYPTVGQTIDKAAHGLLGALLVGVGEEALFRGILLRRIMADFGKTTGVVVTTAIYAVVHVLRNGPKIAASPTAGIERTLALFAPAAAPATWSTIGGLALLGTVLVWARLRTGSLWMPIGIHAAWVSVFRVGRLFVRIRRRPVWVVGASWPPLIGGAAGIAGVVVSGILLMRWSRARRGG